MIAHNWIPQEDSATGSLAVSDRSIAASVSEEARFLGLAHASHLIFTATVGTRKNFSITVINGPPCAKDNKAHKGTTVRQRDGQQR